ncbi:MAG TPA: TonB-dependent receptor [Caulobacteraceae bacterium]|jgi:outer membrane receptor protein involved in Fe transport
MICGAAALALAAPAMAQDQAAADTEVEALVVTGSRIPTPNLTSTSPLQVVTDQEAKLQGTTNVENLLNNLPQVFADFGSAQSNGATGTATVNLRNLGSQRTLVLIDGRRLMPGDPQLPVADLNVIPAALVDRVEVVTGGASAVYGSDAIAGVVNFIMKKDFEGVRLDAQYSFAQHHNNNEEAQRIVPDPVLTFGGPFPLPDDNVTTGQTFDITAIVGVNSADGKGNATIYAGYRNMQAVTQDQYDYTSCAVGTINLTGPVYDTHVCFGSSNYNRIISLDTGADLFPETDRTFSPYAGQSFNFAPFNYLQRPDERYTLGGFAHYEISPMFDVYMDTMFSDDNTTAQIAPSGIFLSTVYQINCDNPLLSAQQRQVLCTDAGLGPTDNASTLIGRRNIEGGARQDVLRHTAYRIVLGTRGEIGSGWRYDLYGQYGLTLYTERYLNELDKDRIQNALLVNPDGTCQTDAANCVPFDLFGGLGSITPEMLGYVGATGFKEGTTEEQIASLNITGDLGQYGLKSPWANDGLGIALGAEYRREALELTTSREFQTGNLSGGGGTTASVPRSSFDVKELFTEIRIPIVQDAPFFRTLQLEAGFRYSDYSSAGTVESYKLAAEWAPVDDIRFRASLQRAVRAPNVLELFSPQSSALFGGNDPCAGASPAFSLAQCQAQGVTAAQYGKIVQCPAAQCQQLIGGNPNVTPEESDTFAVGLVFTPTFFRGFTATIDFFDITVENLIGTIGATTIIQQCGATLDPTFCSLITRDPGTGALFIEGTSFVSNINLNTGSLKTQGIDLEMNYRTSFADMGMGEWGTIGINFVGTFTDSLEIQPLTNGGSYDCAGLFGLTCGTPIPEWRHKLRVTWGTPWDVQVSVNWRHFSSVELDTNQNDPFLNGGFVDTADAEIPSYNYIDLSGTWAVRDGTTLRFGVNNLFDKDPPILDSNNVGVSAPPFGNGNTFPQVYDSLGRVFFVGITADF